MADWPNNGKLSARHGRRACDTSVRRLQTPVSEQSIYSLFPGPGGPAPEANTW